MITFLLVQEKVIVRNYTMCVEPKCQNAKVFYYLVLLYLEVSRSRVVSLTPLLIYQRILNFLGFLEVIDRLDEALLTVKVDLFGLWSENAS